MVKIFDLQFLMIEMIVEVTLDLESTLADGAYRLPESVWMFSNKTALGLLDFCHHLSPFGYNTSETTNMSDREETKGKARRASKRPFGLNRLEVSIFSRQERTIRATSSIDSIMFFSTKSFIDLSFGRSGQPMSNR